MSIKDAVNLTDYKIKVFLVDDQRIVAESVKKMLQTESDIEFNYCMDPTKAIQEAISINPTVILQDLIMPDIDGLTLVKFFRAKKELKDIPLIVLSSKEEPEIKAKAFELGANDYFVKDFDPKKRADIELKARIRYHSKSYINLLQRNEAYLALKKSQEELASELQKAADYVKSLLPEPIESGNLRTRWMFVPSADLGGDAFGYHWIDDDHFAVYLLDVCGHGVGSALLSVSAYNTMRAQTLSGVNFRKPEEVLTQLNKSYQMAEQNDLYFTMWYGVYNKQTSELRYSSAGHPPALLLNNNIEKVQLMNDNFIVGGVPEFPFKSTVVKVEKPASLYIYSDGVYEIEKPDGKMWSLNEFIDFMADHANESGSEIKELYDFVKELFGSEVLDDDFSMIKVSLE
jgi:sigma-B regulation protein RsbU (phosphoserine phosphatase)